MYNTCPPITGIFDQEEEEEEEKEERGNAFYHPMSSLDDSNFIVYLFHEDRFCSRCFKHCLTNDDNPIMYK